MGVGSVTSLNSALVSGVLRSAHSQASGGATALGFGPAYVLGGSTRNFTEGLYNSLGGMLSANSARPTAAEVAKSASADSAKRLADAAELIDGGDTQGGRKAAEAVLENDADNAAALHLIAYSQVEDGDYKTAEEFYTKAAAADPGNERIKAGLADARTLQKDDDDVLAEARAKIENASTREEGLDLLFRLAARSPDNTGAYLALADGFRLADAPEQVIGALQKALKTAGGQEVNDVIQQAERLVDENPEVGLAHNLLGRAFEKAGRTSESIAALRTASSQSPDSTAYVYDLANAYVASASAKLDKNNLASAQADLYAAQSIDPANGGLPELSARVAAERAGADIAAGLYSRALAKLSTAVAKAPDDDTFKRKAAALYGRAASHFEGQGAGAVALSGFRKAFELDPDSSYFRRKVGELSYSEGSDALTRKRYDTAIAHLERAYQTNKFNDNYRQALANAYDKRGQLRSNLADAAGALADFKKGFSLDPANTSLDANLSTALNSSS